MLSKNSDRTGLITNWCETLTTSVIYKNIRLMKPALPVHRLDRLNGDMNWDTTVQ